MLYGRTSLSTQAVFARSNRETSNADMRKIVSGRTTRDKLNRYGQSRVIQTLNARAPAQPGMLRSLPHPTDKPQASPNRETINQRGDVRAFLQIAHCLNEAINPRSRHRPHSRRCTVAQLRLDRVPSDAVGVPAIRHVRPMDICRAATGSYADRVGAGNARGIVLH